MQTTFFNLGRFLKKLADDDCSSITKGSIYHSKTYIHTTFYHSSGLTRNLMLNGRIYYTAFLLGAAELWSMHQALQLCLCIKLTFFFCHRIIIMVHFSCAQHFFSEKLDSLQPVNIIMFEKQDINKNINIL